MRTFTRSRNHHWWIDGRSESYRFYFWCSRSEIVSPDPTYLSLLTYAAQFGTNINRVPLNDRLEHDLEEMNRRVTNETKLVFVCNPNNPTGTIIPK